MLRLRTLFESNEEKSRHTSFKRRRKLILDWMMVVTLLLLMSYELIGKALHEWLGIGMFLLVIGHHIINIRWSKAALKGKYTPYRIVLTVLVMLSGLCIISSIISGIWLSQFVFPFQHDFGGRYFARNWHMLSTYWGFAFMSLHFGLHLEMILRKSKHHKSNKEKKLYKIGKYTIGIYGLYVLEKRHILKYMLLKEQFVFFDFEEPYILFLLDYISVMGMFAVVGNCMAINLKEKTLS